MKELGVPIDIRTQYSIHNERNRYTHTCHHLSFAPPRSSPCCLSLWHHSTTIITIINRFSGHIPGHVKKRYEAWIIPNWHIPARYSVNTCILGARKMINPIVTNAKVKIIRPQSRNTGSPNLLVFNFAFFINAPDNTKGTYSNP